MTGNVDVDLSGRWRAAVADEALRRDYPDADFADDAWEDLDVPGHWRAHAAFAGTDGPLLYRTRFGDPGTFGPGSPGEASGNGSGPAVVGDPGARRTWLVLDGIFYTSDVWLDGAYLGDTEGYFFPHAFEVTEALAARSEHVLALEVGCAPQTDRAHKRNLTGVFQHWDLRDQDGNPGGIWRPVRLEQSGPVRIRHLRALCRDAETASATVFVRAVLDAVEAGPVTLVTRIAGTEVRAEQPLAAGENRVEWTVTVPEPRLWWPHTLGEPHLEGLTVEVRTADGALSDRRARRIGLRRVVMRNWIVSVNGERLFLKGANQGPTAMALAEASDDDLRRDVALAREANLDFLRVHAHVSRPAFYDAADEAGLLLWQDMPLQWGYHRSVRRQARRQARELVDLLAHHPSVFVWCGHKEPMAIDVEPTTITEPGPRNRLIRTAVRQQVLPSWNKSVLDHAIRKVLDRCDGSRPVVPHSGVFPHPPQLDGTDTHTYFGWYYGDERDFEALVRSWPRLARFVTEFGAQAVPEDASFLEPERWPDLDWDRAYRRHALQKPFMDRYVPADAFATFDEWRAATQAYQAQVIRSHIETLRRVKYRPCGGFAQFCFADGHPSVTWSVLGHDRAPKAGFDALREACRPVIVVADRLPPHVHPGDPIALDVHVISDARIALSDMIVRAHLSWEEGAESGPLGAGNGAPPTQGPSRPEPEEWSWQGEIPADTCVRVGTVATTVPHEAEAVVLRLELSGDAPGFDGPVVRLDRTSVVRGAHQH
jgi:beta-mannosidase